MAVDEEKGDELTNLQDDMVKLVAYSIVSLKRGEEKIMDGGEGSIIVTDNMTKKAFTTMLIAQYFQKKVDDPKDPAGKRKIPRIELLQQDSKWKSGDLKYLRVYYVVSTRWPREPLKFEQNQVKVLREIRDEISRT